MSSDRRLRMRGVALIIVLALVGPLAALTTIAPAQAEDEAQKVWAGPGCDPLEYACQPVNGTIDQETDGGDLEAVCTLEECEISQTNTTGSNTLRCEQERTTNGDLSCDIVQVNKSGDNDAEVKQDTTIANLDVLLVSVEQEADQTVTADQANQTGANSLDVEQDVAQTATTLVTGAASQVQEAHQVVDVAEMTSTSGDQTLTVHQTEVLTADLGGAEATQHQNTSDEIGQTFVIGHDDDTIGMDTDTGTNTIVYGQKQTFTQAADGPGGLPTLRASEQIQGAKDEKFPAAFASWKVDSNIAEGTDVRGSQLKEWNQNTTPDQPSLGKVQDMWDELAIIGQLFSADTSSTTQEASLIQNGGRQRCDQRADVHADKLAEHEQNCNGEIQEGSGENLNMHLRRCKGFESTEEEEEEECENATVNESTPAEEIDEGGGDGCSQGEWKTSVDSWPDQVQPDDLFVDHFEGADVRFENLADLEMLDAINLPGGGGTLEGAAGNLARKAVAGLLNAESDLVAYELHSTELRQQVNDALAFGTRDEILDLKNELQGFNTGECPL